MNSRIILISKDAMHKGYLPIYGNKIWTTPNIDYLAKEGTVFHNYYTAAPSSAMAYLSMFTGKFPHETSFKKYSIIDEEASQESMFDKLHQDGYKCHIIWDKMWMSTAKRHSECYGKNTVIHPIDNLRQGVGAHYLHEGFLQANENVAIETLKRLESKIADVSNSNSKDNLFLWVHLPHVINGRTGYGSDIDLFDKCVGICRKYFEDNNIFISADHGNMNGSKNKICYGFDVYNPAINIPLITPRIDKIDNCYTNISCVDLYDIISKKQIIEREYIYSDTAYYAQPNRKLAIIYKNYKYIYNKKDKTEELYDLEYDKEENCNLMNDKVYDIDRHIYAPLRELYFYPDWGNVVKVRSLLRAEKNRIWVKENVNEYMYNSIKEIMKILYHKTSVLKNNLKKSLKKVKGIYYG